VSSEIEESQDIAVGIADYPNSSFSLLRYNGRDDEPDAQYDGNGWYGDDGRYTWNYGHAMNVISISESNDG